MSHNNSVQEEYAILLSQPEWHRIREIVLKKDGNACVNCGSTEKLQIHHKQYHYMKNDGRFVLPWEYDLDYLITLCSKCHEFGHLKYRTPIFNI